MLFHRLYYWGSKGLGSMSLGSHTAIYWEWRKSIPTRLLLISLRLIQDSIFLNQYCFLTVMLWCLFHTLFSSLGLWRYLMFYQNCVNWRPRLVDAWWNPQILGDPCSFFLAPASLDYQLVWLCCKLRPSCSEKPSGVLIYLGSHETYSFIFIKSGSSM